MENTNQLEVAALTQYWMQEISGLSLITRFTPKKATLVIDQIVVPKLLRRTGVGTRIMTDFTALADKNNVIIALSPSNVFGLPEASLEVFYMKFGFRTFKPTKNDSETMVRYPLQ